MSRSSTPTTDTSMSETSHPEKDGIAGVDLEKGVVDLAIAVPVLQEPTANRDTTEGPPKQRTPDSNQDDKANIPTRTITGMDWDGPDDPENPHNWSKLRRGYNTIATALLAFAVTFGTSVYTPGYPDVAKEFGVSTTAAITPLTSYTVGLALGPMIAAPISETRGRLIVYQVSIPLFMLFTLGTGFSQNIAQLVILRFFAGTMGAPVLAVGAGTNADLWPLRSRAIASAAFITMPFLGPAFGPAVGGYAAKDLGWRWTSWSLLFVTIPLWLFSLGMSETYKKIILKRRAKKLGIEPSKPPPFLSMMKTLFTVTLLRPVHMLLTEPIVTSTSLYCAYAFAVLYAFFAGFPIIFRTLYDFNQGESGLTFIAVGVGVLSATLSIIITDRTLYQKQFRKAVAAGKHIVAPEHRLYAAMAGSFGLPIGLFWCAWTARSDIHWIVPVLSAIPFGWGNLMIFVSAALYSIDTYGPLNGASAVAANGLLRYVFGAVFPLFTVQMYNSLGIDWAISLFGFLSLLLLPIPWVLFKWGPKIRSYSSYDTIKA